MTFLFLLVSPILHNTVLIPFKTAAYINYNTKIRVMTDPEPQYIKKNPKDGEKKTVIK